MATYTYNIEGTATPVTAGIVTAFSISSTANIRINSVTLHGVKSSYVVSEQIQDVVLTCSIGGTYTIGKNFDDAVFSVNRDYSAGQSIGVTISRNVGTFELLNGLSPTKILSPDGAAGLLNTSTANIPKFSINYDILDEGYSRNDSINEGYPFLDGLLTDYGDCIPEAAWYIDELGTINDGYPFLDGLLTDYGDYVDDVGGLLMYKNGVRLKAYKDGAEIIPQKQGV